jgi:hypothetical protein
MLKKIILLTIIILFVSNHKDSNNCEILKEVDSSFLCISKSYIYELDDKKFFTTYKDRDEFIVMEILGKAALSKFLKNEYEFKLDKKIETKDTTFYIFEFDRNYHSLEKLTIKNWNDFLIVIKNILEALEFFRENSEGNIPLQTKNIFVNMEDFKIKFLHLGMKNVANTHEKIQKIHTLNEFKDLYHFLSKINQIENLSLSNDNKLKLVSFLSPIKEYVDNLTEQTFIYHQLIDFFSQKIVQSNKLKKITKEKNSSQILEENINHIRIFFVLILFIVFIILASFTFGLVFKKQRDISEQDFRFDEPAIDSNQFKKLFK